MTGAKKGENIYIEGEEEKENNVRTKKGEEKEDIDVEEQ